MTTDPSTKRPLISVILATFNEAANVEGCIASLLEQEAPDFDLEILAIDGNSDDDTRKILERAAAIDPRVRVLTNPKRRAPFAFNIGLQEAAGEYVCILGAHTIYNRDYISVCLRELLANRAVACGGRVITQPARNTLQARLVAWAFGHPFGSSRKSFRTQPEGFVDTVNYPVMVREALIEAGGYDEELLRNQDNDMSQKLRAKGHKLLCTWKTQCFYHPKAKVKDLLRYARGNGFWNVISAKKNLASMSARHFIPFAFLISVLAGFVLGVAGAFLPAPYRTIAWAPLAAILMLHLCGGWMAAFQIAIRERSPGALLLPPVFLAFHLAYGYGTLSAIVSQAEPPASLSEPVITT